MSEVRAEFFRAVAEDSTMVVTPEMAFRDCIAEWRASQPPELPPGARPVEWLDPAELVERYPAMDAREATRESPLLAAMTRATPARALRLRLYTDRLEGPGWLGLLCQCAWLRGGIVGAGDGTMGTQPRVLERLVRVPPTSSLTPSDLT